MTLFRTRGPKSAAPTRNPWAVRPRLVGLEDRTTPATFEWNVDADGAWNNPANWKDWEADAKDE